MIEWVFSFDAALAGVERLPPDKNNPPALRQARPIG